MLPGELFNISADLLSGQPLNQVVKAFLVVVCMIYCYSTVVVSTTVWELPPWASLLNNPDNSVLPSGCMLYEFSLSKLT